MMLRNLVDEVVRRRLWPIPLAALVVVVAAPLLFLKSAPPPAATDATVASAAADADLPARARRLLTTTDAGHTSGRRLSSSARDPFQAPASRSAAAKKAARKAKSSSSSSSSSKQGETTPKGTRSNPVSVIVLTPNTAKTKDSTSTGTGTSTSRSTTSDSDSTEKSLPTVDVRFGAHKDSPIQRRIQRLKTFEVGGDAAVIFVKYSPSRHKAVFAINPTTTVRGDNRCRRVSGVCSYVDIPAGSYARLTFTRPDGSRVSRRLDVVRVHGDA